MAGTGDVVWAWHGFVVLPILDGIHYRPDDEKHLARIYVAAKEKGIPLKPILQLVPEILNTEPNNLGKISTGELIAYIPKKAHKTIEQPRTMFLIDKED